jgi:tetratricopeptide (TPR) repeat protein
MLASAVIVAALPACERLLPGKSAPEATETAPAPASPVQDARALFDAGQLDAALARLQGMDGDPDALHLQGLVWAKKAESAPLPTPPPPPSPLPRHWVTPAAPEFKHEELRALDLLERAIAVQPDHAGAQLAVAELLAPHAARRHETLAAAAARRGKRPARPADAAPAEAGPDFSAERVLRGYRAAFAGDATARPAIEGLIAFATRIGRPDDAQAGFDELIRRDREKPEPLVRYGDFLATQKKDVHAAIEAYRQALIWRPDDDATRAKIADIYIALGIEHYKAGEWATAEARFADAEKWVSDRNSPQGLKIQDHQGKLRQIRRPAVR